MVAEPPLIFLEKELHKHLGFVIPNRVGSGLQFVNIVSEFIDLVRAAEKKQAAPTATNSNYAAALEEDYRVLNRMSGVLKGCRDELAAVIEHLNAAK